MSGGVGVGYQSRTNLPVRRNERGYAPVNNLPAVLHSILAAEPAEPQRQAQLSQAALDTGQFVLERVTRSLPSSKIIRELFESYFRFIHPHLPILTESEIWALFDAKGEFSPGSFSPLLIRAILFSSSQFLSAEGLAASEATNKRDARITFYDQAKLMLDFDTLSTDLVCKAQACLLLSYHVPFKNAERTNSYWLVNAVRYARISRADTYWLVKDPDLRNRLKRLWWACLCRNFILSFGLRRAPAVSLDAVTSQPDQILTAADFSHDHGRSRVFSVRQQNRLYDLISTSCRFAQASGPTLELLYRHEIIPARVIVLRNQLANVEEAIDTNSKDLWEWYRNALAAFPSPISIDEDSTSDSVIIFANMLFCYHATAQFGIQQLRLLIDQVVVQPPRSDPVVLEQISNIMEGAMDDLGSRMQELLQTRLAHCLPMSMSAYVILPLTLQAINLASARGSEMQERVEARRLEIFKKVLESQRLLFDGSDFAIRIFDDVSSAYETQENLSNLPHSRVKGRNSTMLASYWPHLVVQRPREFLILLLQLDRLLVATIIATEEDYMPVEFLQNQGQETLSTE